ncbi:MAG: hypothetical protein Q9184_003559 [Pyrenodesmia sp. 2 TL-2023]
MSKASLWFVSDEEFDVATEDYALVNESATWLQHGLADNFTFEGDDDSFSDEYFDGEERRLTFQDVAKNIVSYSNSFALNAGSQLIYADVDGDDKIHREINTRIAKQGFLDEAPEQCRQAREKLIRHLVQVSLDSHVEEGCSSSPEHDAEEIRKDMEAELRRNKGIVSPTIIDYLISLEKDEDQEATLSVLSNQTLRKTYRPVMLLIGMIDKGSVREPGSKEGWAIAYSFHTNRITIKPYVFDNSHHPLAEKWDAELPKDDICFFGQPSDFVGKLSQLTANNKGMNPVQSDVEYGFRILVHYFVAHWIVCHEKALIKMPAVGGKAAMTDEELEKVKEAMRAILKELANIDFPEKVQHPTTRQPIEIFLHLQRDLENWEPIIRKQAIKAKEAGDKDTANKAAELYENLWQQLQAFNMSPNR